MDHFAGLDVSVKETSICIVDDTGKIVREVKVASEPEALLQVLMNPAYHFKRIGLEAGPLSQWLFSALAEAGLPVICVETRHMRGGLEGAGQQDGLQRCTRHCADDASGRQGVAGAAGPFAGPPAFRRQGRRQRRQMLFAIMPVEESQPYQVGRTPPPGRRPAPNGAPAAVGGVGNVHGTDISGRLDPSGHD
jgi:hypothetical protein